MGLLITSVLRSKDTSHPHSTPMNQPIFAEPDQAEISLLILRFCFRHLELSWQLMGTHLAMPWLKSLRAVLERKGYQYNA